MDIAWYIASGGSLTYRPLGDASTESAGRVGPTLLRREHKGHSNPRLGGSLALPGLQLPLGIDLWNGGEHNGPGSALGSRSTKLIAEEAPLIKEALV